MSSTQKKGKEFLENAFHCSHKTEYISEFPSPFKNRFDWCATIKAYHRFEFLTGKEFWRFDFLDSKHKIKISLLENADGVYVTLWDKENKSFAGNAFLELYWLETLALDIYPAEMMYSDYIFSTEKISGRNYDKIKVKLPTKLDTDTQIAITGTGITKEQFKNFKGSRPYIREFWIDNQYKNVYRRRHVNAFGKVILDITLGNVDYFPDWTKYPNIFDTPSNVIETIANLNDFDDLKNHLGYYPRESFQKSFTDYFKKFWKFALSNSGQKTLSLLFLILGAVGFTIIAYIRKK